MILNLAENDFLRLTKRIMWDRAAALVKNCMSGVLERRTVSELERLSDHALRDIGLTRGDIDGAVRRCFAD